MRLIAIKPHRYPANTLNTREIGEEYEAPKEDAFVLIGARLSKQATPIVGESSYQTKEQKATPLPEDKPVRTKRQYGRKDMTPA